MKTTKIEWTDKTWNPVTGCSKISAGCANCYAEVMARRLKAMGQEKYKDGFDVTLHHSVLQDPVHWQKPHTIFVCSMSYSVPISLRGRYYYRSGSVKQELTGAALNEFLLKRAGHTWDDVIDARATFDDIDERTIKIFLRKAEEAGRLPDIDGLSTSELLEKLRLAKNGQLKRAAIVLFGKDTGAFYPIQTPLSKSANLKTMDLRFVSRNWKKAILFWYWTPCI